MKKTLLISVFLCVNLLTFSQTLTAKFDDGTEINYDVLKDKFNDSKPLNLMWEGLSMNNLDGQSYIFGASYYSADKFYTSAHLGLLGGFSFLVDGIYFISSWDKEKTLKFSVKEEYVGANTIKKYVVSHQLEKHYLWGPHIGYGFANITTDTYKNSGEIEVGVSIFRGKFLNVLIQNEKRKAVKKRGTTQFALYADFVHYFIDYNADVTGKTIPKSGIRVHLRGKTGFWGTRDFGACYSLGFGTGGTVKVYPVMGLGIYGGF